MRVDVYPHMDRLAKNIPTAEKLKNLQHRHVNGHI